MMLFGKLLVNSVSTLSWCSWFLLIVIPNLGRVESLVRRDVNVDMNNNTEQQYAFIRYRNRQDARYAITTGEVNFYGRKL